MNRPIWNLHTWDNYEDYVNGLEKYCDELETEISILNTKLEFYYERAEYEAEYGE